ncbi:hypothetical protein [Arthrobacter sp. Br18]|uniref:hypothetical protein n=1 Tax=Arthrobacter sp. Br18 TaxID=1312954 RepID=UPI00047B8E04|nr:hypothetical protein [Arthrobacter sp. Br18]
MTPRGQEPNESTDDEVWLDIVARLEQTPPGTAPEPARKDTPAGAPAADPLPPNPFLTDRQRADAVFENQPLRPPGPRDYEATETGNDDGRYVPPEPPPLGAGDPLLVLSWLAAAGGPVLLLVIAMFWRSAPLSVWLGVLAVFVAGAGYLLTRLPGSRDDDGAEV